MTQTVFDEVEVLLAQQLDRATHGDIDSVQRLAEQVGGLMDQARAAGMTPDPDVANRMNRLYDAMGLAIAQRADEVLRQRTRLRQGRQTLRAYRRA